MFIPTRYVLPENATWGQHGDPVKAVSLKSYSFEQQLPIKTYAEHYQDLRQNKVFGVPMPLYSTGASIWSYCLCCWKPWPRECLAEMRQTWVFEDGVEQTTNTTTCHECADEMVDYLPEKNQAYWQLIVDAAYLRARWEESPLYKSGSFGKLIAVGNPGTSDVVVGEGLPFKSTPVMPVKLALPVEPVPPPLRELRLPPATSPRLVIPQRPASASRGLDRLTERLQKLKLPEQR